MLSGIQHFIIAIITAVTLILPFHKPPVHPTPTPQQTVQAKKEATPSAKVLGAEQKNNNDNQNKSPKPKVSFQTSPSIQTPTPSPSTAAAALIPPGSTATSNTPPQQNVVTVPISKPDYSSYKISLGYALSSLNNRLNSIRSNANNIPAQVQAAKDAINAKLQSDLGNLEVNYNKAIQTTSLSFGRRGLVAQPQDYQPITESYNSQKQALIDQANQNISQATNNGINLVYQADAQDKDLSNKINIVQGLINKIDNGSFTDSDIPLTLQVINY